MSTSHRGPWADTGAAARSAALAEVSVDAGEYVTCDYGDGSQRLEPVGADRPAITVETAYRLDYADWYRSRFPDDVPFIPGAATPGRPPVQAPEAEAPEAPREAGKAPGEAPRRPRKAGRSAKAAGIGLALAVIVALTGCGQSHQDPGWCDFYQSIAAGYQAHQGYVPADVQSSVDEYCPS